jgi:hypothetical protein
MQPLRLIILLVLAAPLLAANKPASRPVDPLMQPARDAVKGRSLAAFGAEAEKQLRAELEKPEPEHAEVLRLAAWREFARYFARVNTSEAGHLDTLAWLAGQPEVLGVVMMSVTGSDPPERVLEVLRALRADHRERIEDFPELAAAVCVVWDAHERFGGNPMADEEVRIDPDEPTRVFAHFARNAERLAIDPRKLPVDLLAYIVDTQLTGDELAWAQRYGPRPNVAGAFFAVPFREGVYYERRGATAPPPPPGPGGRAEVVVQEVTRNSYVLPNILRRGGGVMEQAYFAAEVARANGVPAAVCVSTIENPAAVWAGFLTSSGARHAWDATGARHAQHVPWIGFAQDPQTYEWRSEAELTVLAGVAATPRRERLTSLALFKSADLPRGATERAAMLAKSIGVMPANRHAWYALADLAAAEKFDDAAMKPVEELMKQHLDRRWPEFATVLRLRAVKSRGTIEFDAGISRAADAVRDRPELVAMVRLAQVERYREDRKNKESIELLVKLLQRQPPLSAPSAWAVMVQLDDLLHREDDLPRLNEIYRAVFGALPRPNPSYHMRTTAYWRMGWKYADLLDEMKDPQAAGALRTKLENLVTPAPAPVE